jgi:NADPH:quinone reductase-like Zn-dependent oxidoreductase
MTDVTMNAVRLHGLGDPARLRYERVPRPKPAAAEVLVRVHAAAITRGELDWPEDRLPATPSYEFSGVVAATGLGVDRVQPGDAVYGLSDFDRDGAAAEYIVVPEDVLAPKPEALGHVESAAIPLAGLSAWQGLFDYGSLSRGQRVLIHGAAGGVGGFAVQLARARGAHVIGTASAGNVRTTLELGAHEVVAHPDSRFEDVVDPVDLVFDTAGGERLERSPSVVRPGGKLVSIATEPPPDAASRGIEAVSFIVEPNRQQLMELGRLAATGELRVPVDQIFPLRDAELHSSEVSDEIATARLSSMSPPTREERCPLPVPRICRMAPCRRAVYQGRRHPQECGARGACSTRTWRTSKCPRGTRTRQRRTQRPHLLL